MDDGQPGPIDRHTTQEEEERLNINVRQTMFDLIILGDSECAKRLAILYDIDFDEYMEENSGEIVFAKLKEE